eukprot:5078882-Pyramimonas_sp.AAC.1
MKRDLGRRVYFNIVDESWVCNGPPPPPRHQPPAPPPPPSSSSFSSLSRGPLAGLLREALRDGLAVRLGHPPGRRAHAAPGDARPRCPPGRGARPSGAVSAA